MKECKGKQELAEYCKKCKYWRPDWNINKDNESCQMNYHVWKEKK